jgi:hypothetical protein
MFLAGLAAFLQITIIPGWILSRAVRGRPVAYAFGLTLIVNYLLAEWAVALGVYSPAFIYALWCVEGAAVVVLLWLRDARVEIPVQEWLQLDRPVVATAAAALAAVLIALLIFATNFGNVFSTGDDVASWDRWAMEWATGSQPSSGYYPQLLPANWSITYLAMQTTAVKMFAKGIMPLFLLGSLLLLVDLYRRTKQTAWLLAAPVLLLFYQYAFSEPMLVAGYMDVPAGFFALLTIHSLILLDRDPAPAAVAFLLPVLFASAATQTKQGAVYFLAVALIWVLRRSGLRIGIAAAAVVVIVNWRLLATQVRVWRGLESTNLGYLTGAIHEGRSYWERCLHAIDLIRLTRGLEAQWFALPALALILLAAAHPRGRRILLLFVLPFSVAWALFFSYELRTLAIIFPAAAYCAACGVEVALLRTGWWGRAAAVALCGLAIWMAPLRLFLRTVWAAELAHAWTWPLAFSAALAVALLIARRRVIEARPIDVNLAAWVVPAVLIAVVLNATVLTADVLLKDQEAKRRLIGYPTTNARLYAMEARGELCGVVATEYWFLQFLPDLGQRFHGHGFGELNLDAAAAITANPSVRFLLLPDRKIAPAARSGLAAAGYDVVFTDPESQFTLLRAPGGCAAK